MMKKLRQMIVKIIPDSLYQQIKVFKRYAFSGSCRRLDHEHILYSISKCQ